MKNTVDLELMNNDEQIDYLQSNKIVLSIKHAALTMIVALVLYIFLAILVLDSAPMNLVIIGGILTVCIIGVAQFVKKMVKTNNTVKNINQ